MGLNVFKDLGFDDGYAAEMDLRVAVAVQIHDLIKVQRMTQVQASQFFGVPQPTISKIIRLNLDRISLALLLRMLFRSRTPFALEFGGDAQSTAVTVGSPQSSAQVVKSEWDMSPGAPPAADRAEVRFGSSASPDYEPAASLGTGN